MFLIVIIKKCTHFVPKDNILIAVKIFFIKGKFVQNIAWT